MKKINNMNTDIKKLTTEQLRSLRGKINNELGCRLTKATLTTEQISLRARCRRYGIGWKDCQKMKKKDFERLGIAFHSNIK
jgi:hypothetical protein